MALLKGLEVSEVKLEQALEINRIDSEFYKPSLIRLDQKIASVKGESLDSLCEFLVGPFGSEFSVKNYEATECGKYRYVRGKDVKNFFLEETDNVFIPESDFDRLSKHALREGDLLISVVGTIGNCCIVRSENIPTIFSCKSTVVRNTKVDPWYLLTYLNTSLGKSLLYRNSRGAIQLGLNLIDLKRLKIPLVSKKLQSGIRLTVENALSKKLEAKKLQQKAEQTLLSALGLEDWEPPNPLTYEASVQDSFTAGRLDAEFFQEKYQSIEKRLSIHPLRRFSEDCFVLKGKTVPYVDSGHVRIIRSGDLNDISDPKKFKECLDSEDYFPLEKGDVLISSIGFGSIGKVQVFDLDIPCGTVSEVTVIRAQSLNPYYVCAYLRSIAGQLQFERWTTGATGQLHLYARDVKQMFIPAIDNNQQKNFEKLSKKQNELLQKSKDLLERAKRAVEIAIEKNEEAAIRFLSSEK